MNRGTLQCRSAYVAWQSERNMTKTASYLVLLIFQHVRTLKQQSAQHQQLFSTSWTNLYVKCLHKVFFSNSAHQYEPDC